MFKVTILISCNMRRCNHMAIKSRRRKSSPDDNAHCKSDCFHCMMNDVPTEISTQDATHCHQSALAEIDDMNKELEQLKENLFKTRVKSHILHVDLATQFSPHMVEKLRRVKEDCNRCSMTVNIHLQADQK